MPVFGVHALDSGPGDRPFPGVRREKGMLSGRPAADSRSDNKLKKKTGMWDTEDSMQMADA